MQTVGTYQITSVSDINSHTGAILERLRKGQSVTIEFTIDAKTTRKYTCTWDTKTQEGKFDRDKTDTTWFGRFREFWARNPGFNSSNATQLTGRLRTADKAAQLASAKTTITTAKTTIQNLCSERLYGALPSRSFHQSRQLQNLRDSNDKYVSAIKAHTDPILKQLTDLETQLASLDPDKMRLCAFQTKMAKVDRTAQKITAIEKIDSKNRENLAIIAACKESDYLLHSLAPRIFHHVEQVLNKHSKTATTIPVIPQEPVWEKLVTPSGDNQETVLKKCSTLVTTPVNQKNPATSTFADHCNTFLGDLLSDPVKKWTDIKAGIKTLSEHRETLDKQIKTEAAITEFIGDQSNCTDETQVNKLNSAKIDCSTSQGLLNSKQMQNIETTVTALMQTIIHGRAAPIAAGITDFLGRYEGQGILSTRFDTTRQSQIDELQKMQLSSNDPALTSQQLNEIITKSKICMDDIAKWVEEQGAFKKITDFTGNVFDSVNSNGSGSPSPKTSSSSSSPEPSYSPSSSYNGGHEFNTVNSQLTGNFNSGTFYDNDTY